MHRTFAIDADPKGIDHAPQQAHADWNGKQAPGRTHLLTSHDILVFTEENGADLRLFQVQRDAEEAVAEVDHLIEHHATETLDARHAIADLPDDANIGVRGSGLK